jgi:hypothetical protein
MKIFSVSPVGLLLENHKPRRGKSNRCIVLIGGGATLIAYFLMGRVNVESFKCRRLQSKSGLSLNKFTTVKWITDVALLISIVQPVGG